MFVIALKFIVCLLIVLFMGRRVAIYGDIIAHKTGLGGVWIGLVLLAMVTSLPEVFIGISSVTIVGVPDLTISNVLGANSYNLLTLALLDIAYKKSSIAKTASSNHRLTAWFSLLLTAIAAIAIFTSLKYQVPGLGWIGWYTPVIIIVYLYAVRRISQVELNQDRLSEEKVKNPGYDAMPIRKVYLHFTGSAVLIIGAGIWLAFLGDELATTTGWGASCIGSLLISFTTTLPEITVSFSALRIGAIDLAVSNIIGSNLFNILIIALDDLFYLKGPVLSSIAPDNLITVTMIILMTLLFLAAFYFKPGKLWRISWYNCITIVLFLITAYLSFTSA